MVILNQDGKRGDGLESRNTKVLILAENWHVDLLFGYL
jgi:hypothetical protein